MAIYDQSYTPWTGTYTSRAARIRAMIAMELAQPFKNVWVLVSVLLAFSLVIGWLLILFIAGSSQVPLPFAFGNRIYRDGFYNFPTGSSFTLFSIILMALSAMSKERRALLVTGEESAAQVKLRAQRSQTVVVGGHREPRSVSASGRLDRSRPRNSSTTA